MLCDGNRWTEYRQRENLGNRGGMVGVCLGEGGMNKF